VIGDESYQFAGEDLFVHDIELALPLRPIDVYRIVIAIKTNVAS
jgi:hypothetical protein